MSDAPAQIRALYDNDPDRDAYESIADAVERAIAVRDEAISDLVGRLPMRTPIAATLTALTLAAGLTACTASPEPGTEAGPVPPSASAATSPTPSSRAATASPREEAAAPEDPAAEAEALYAKFELDYPGPAVVEETSLGLCGQFPDPGVGTAFRELITYGGYEAEDAAAAVLTAAAVYCPDQRPAVEEWVDAVGGMDDWAQEAGTLGE